METKRNGAVDALREAYPNLYREIEMETKSTGAHAGSTNPDPDMRDYENRGTYNENVVWAHDRSGAMMGREEAHSFRMQHDPVYRAKFMYGMSLPQDQAHEVMVAHDPDYADRYGDAPDARGAIERYAKANPQSSSPAGRRGPSDADRRALAMEDANTRSETAAVRRDIPRPMISPEEMEWRRTQVDAEKGRLAQSLRDSTSSIGPRESREVSPMTAKEREMFYEGLGDFPATRRAGAASVEPTHVAAAYEPDYGGSALKEVLAERVTGRAKAKR